MQQGYRNALRESEFAADTILMQIYGEKIVMADNSAIGTILMVKTKGDDKSV